MATSREQTAPMEQFRRGESQISWRHQRIDISGHGLKTIHFMDTTPNMFMIQNPTDATLYIGITNIPTETHYEWKVNPNTSKTFGRPIACDEVFILNTTSEDVSINLFSVLDRFDLSLLADMTVSLDRSIAAEIKGDGIIKGFGTGVSLPAGTKHIGEVSMSGALPAGTNHIGSVSLDGSTSISAELDDATKANIATSAEKAASSDTYLSQIENNMLSIKNNVTGCYENTRDMLLCMNDTYTGTNMLALILEKLTAISTATAAPTLGETIADTIFYQKTDVTEAQTMVFTETVIDGVTKPATERFYANRMMFFSNDGEKDISMKLYRNSTDYTEITIKAGETVSNWNMKNPVVTIAPKTSGDSISYRIMYGLAESEV